MYVTQPSARPTNKLTAGMLGALSVSVAALIVRNLWPEWDDPDLWLALSPVTVLLFGYIIKDAPNT